MWEEETVLVLVVVPAQVVVVPAQVPPLVAVLSPLVVVHTPFWVWARVWAQPLQVPVSF